MPRARNLMPQLVELTGTAAGRVHELSYGEHVLGRGGGVDIHLDDADVSRRHARLTVAPDGVVVHDMGSKNGIYAQAVRVEGSALLTHGQILSIGELRLRMNHPASQVNRALADAGESTATTTRTETGETQTKMRGLLVPVVGMVLFGALLAAMLIR